MSVILVEGGRKLSGAVTVQGAKKTVCCPCWRATVLCSRRLLPAGCPALSDVDTAVQIIRHLGGTVRREGPDLVVDTRQITGCEIPGTDGPHALVGDVFWGRFWAAAGGCGAAARRLRPGTPAYRPASGGAPWARKLRKKAAACGAGGAALHGAEIFLRTPSVGATENAILAACAASGTTVISNAAREPEIMELQDFLRAMGACVQERQRHRGGGGTERLHGCTHRVRPDRIVAATYLAAQRPVRLAVYTCTGRTIATWQRCCASCRKAAARSAATAGASA